MDDFRETLMCVWQRRLTALAGLLGPAVLTTGCIVTALSCHGGKGEAYSPLNHFVSELGLVGVSELAGVFNGCQTIGGLIIAISMVGLGRHFQTGLAHVAAVLGMVSGMLCGLLGQIPMNDLVPHLAAAFSFFFSGLLGVGLFCLVIARDAKDKLPKWLLLPGLIAFASFAAFMAYPLIARETPAEIIRLYRTARPGIWAIAILEWLVFITVMIWIVLVSVCLWARGAHRAQS